MNTFNRALKFLAFYSLNQMSFFPTRGLSKILNSMDRYLVFSMRFGTIMNQDVAHFTRTMRSYFQIARPPIPGTRPFQAIPHPRDHRTGLVPGVAWGGGGMVTGRIEPCITFAMIEMHTLYKVHDTNSVITILVFLGGRMAEWLGRWISMW